MIFLLATPLFQQEIAAQQLPNPQPILAYFGSSSSIVAIFLIGFIVENTSLAIWRQTAGESVPILRSSLFDFHVPGFPRHLLFFESH